MYKNAVERATVQYSTVLYRADFRLRRCSGVHNRLSKQTGVPLSCTTAHSVGLELFLCALTRSSVSLQCVRYSVHTVLYAEWRGLKARTDEQHTVLHLFWGVTVLFVKPPFSPEMRPYLATSEMLQ